MTWIQTVAEDAATGKLAAIYAGLQRAMPDGRVPNIIKSHSLRPQAVADHLSLYRGLMFGDSGLSRAQRELIAVVVSAANDCPY